MVSAIVGTVIGLALVNLGLGFAAAVVLRWWQERLRHTTMRGTAGGSTALPPASHPPASPASGQEESTQDSQTPSTGTADLAAFLGDQTATARQPAEAGSLGEAEPSWPQAAAELAASSTGPAAQPAATEFRSHGTGAAAPDLPEALQYSPGVLAAPPGSITVPPGPASEEPPPGLAGWEAGVRALEESSRQYRDQLAAIDQHLHTLQAENAQEVLAAAASIRDAGQRYLDEQKKAAQGVLGEAIPPEELAALAGEIQAALEIQTAQIEASDRTLAALGTAGTPEEVHGQCVAESAKLRQASGRVGDVLESALARLTAGAERPPTPAPDDEPSPAGLIARTALEQKIAQWWKEDPQRKRPLALAVLEIDLFEQVGGRFGRDVAHRLVRAVTGIVLAEGGGHALASRCAEPRFGMAFPDADVRLAIYVVERIRQTIERAHFRCHEFDLRITLSAGIVPASPQDTLESLWQRAESALAEARRYGRNRVFVHEGRYPTPVVPPNLDLPEKSFDL